MQKFMAEVDEAVVEKTMTKRQVKKDIGVSYFWPVIWF